MNSLRYALAIGVAIVLVSSATIARDLVKTVEEVENGQPISFTGPRWIRITGGSGSVGLIEGHFAAGASFMDVLYGLPRPFGRLGLGAQLFEGWLAGDESPGYPYVFSFGSATASVVLFSRSRIHIPLRVKDSGEYSSGNWKSKTRRVLGKGRPEDVVSFAVHADCRYHRFARRGVIDKGQTKVPGRNNPYIDISLRLTWGKAVSGAGNWVANEYDTLTVALGYFHWRDQLVNLDGYADRKQFYAAVSIAPTLSYFALRR